MKNNLTLTIGWLYPDLMSTYGDRGNIIVFSKRCEWRGISVQVLPIDQQMTIEELKKVDLIFGGGSQDIQQEIVMRDLMGKKGEMIKKLIDQNIPALFVCGSPQIMGKYYEPAFGKRIEGLGIFDMVSINPGKNKPRCIGNIVAKVLWENLTSHPEVVTEGSQKEMLRSAQHDTTIVGFENHGGRTYLGKGVQPFAKVIKGYGNNGEDKTEGVVYKNAIGCYFHGPLLPKNPEIADYLIQKALEVKYKEKVSLTPLDDVLSQRARKVMIHRIK